MFKPSGLGGRNMSDDSEVSALLELGVALTKAKTFHTLQLKDNHKLFGVSPPFEWNLLEEEEAFLLAIELFPSGIDGYPAALRQFLDQKDVAIRWEIKECIDNNVVAFIALPYDIDLAVAEMKIALMELEHLISEFFEQEIDPFDHDGRTLNFMWLYQ
jgi:hypothetical protein